SVTMAMLAYSIPASAAVAADAPGTPLSSRDAGRAGRASTTASASIRSGSAPDPTVSRQPVAVRASSRTVARVRTVAPDAAATAAGSAPRPLVKVVKTAGRGGGGPDSAGGAGGSRDAAASDRARCDPAAAASGPRVASNDSSSDRPAYTPPSSGAAHRGAR